MPEQSAVNPLVQLFPLALIFIIFYFLLIRPQKQKEKEHQKMLSAVAKNDEIVTMGGIYGSECQGKDIDFTYR